MDRLKIEYVPKETLKPYLNNAKIHTAEQIEQIKRSIEEFSFNDPIAIWHDNEIIEGHGRLLAVMEMDDIKEVPVIRLDELTDEQRRAYMLVHNKLNMNTGFDFSILEMELDDITNIDMQEFGFDEIHLDSFFSDEEQPVKEETRKEDEYRLVCVCKDIDKYAELEDWLKNNGIEYNEL